MPEGPGPRAAAYFTINCDDFVDAKTRTDLLKLPIAKGSSIEVHGYASDDGPADFNQDLSCARAKRVADVLTPRVGAAGARIKSVTGHGGHPGRPLSEWRKTVIVFGPGGTPVAPGSDRPVRVPDIDLTYHPKPLPPPPPSPPPYVPGPPETRTAETTESTKLKLGADIQSDVRTVQVTVLLRDFNLPKLADDATSPTFSIIHEPGVNITAQHPPGLLLGHDTLQWAGAVTLFDVAFKRNGRDFIEFGLPLQVGPQGGQIGPQVELKLGSYFPEFRRQVGDIGIVFSANMSIVPGDPGRPDPSNIVLSARNPQLAIIPDVGVIGHF